MINALIVYVEMVLRVRDNDKHLPHKENESVSVSLRRLPDVIVTSVDVRHEYPLNIKTDKYHTTGQCWLNVGLTS